MLIQFDEFFNMRLYYVLVVRDSLPYQTFIISKFLCCLAEVQLNSNIVPKSGQLTRQKNLFQAWHAHFLECSPRFSISYFTVLY